MFKQVALVVAGGSGFVLLLVAVAALPAADWRNVRNGSVIPDETYCDQPYTVITEDGNWLCVMTTGRGVEGQRRQHIVSTISTDQGKTWSPLVDIEPADGLIEQWGEAIRKVVEGHGKLL